MDMKKISLFTIFNYKVSPELEAILEKLLSEYELKDVVYQLSYIKLVFEKNVEVIAYNECRWHSWFAYGKIYINGELFFKWNEERPRRKTMNKILEKIGNLSIKTLEDKINGKKEDFFDIEI